VRTLRESVAIQYITRKGRDVKSKAVKQYCAEIVVRWATTIEATNQSNLIEKVKEQWKQDYNIELDDSEIKVM